ncbi:hypothetical protein L3X38_004009 [Prunus dulcis]|uniref:Uncharacterized protein n=1 Tax=Prunus dulcis TaxID=3755 RepID=A0AAD4ZN46_PRUDU|nr:hypothetical protein L3X38_004009 [Prunus dulcis]
MLTYGCSAYSIDEYCRLGGSTALECLQKFCSVIKARYGQWYLRSPNPAYLYRLLHKVSRRGFPGMLGSLDYMHFEWKNCPTAWAQWAIVRGHVPALMWRKEQLHSIMMTCIILHIMIVEDKYEDLDAESDDDDNNFPRTSRRTSLAYELEPTITYDINRDRQTISDYMVHHNGSVLRKCITI